MEAWECHTGSSWTSITSALKPQARPGQHFSIMGSPFRTYVQPWGSWQTKDLLVCFFIQQFTLPVTAWSSHGRRRRRRRQIVSLLHVWAVCPSLIRAVVPHGSFAQQLWTQPQGKKKHGEESSWLSCLLAIWCNWEENSNTVVSADALPTWPERSSCARGSTIPTNPHRVCWHPHACEHHAFNMQLMGPGDNKTLLYTPRKSSTPPVVRPGVRLSSWGALVQKYLLLFRLFFLFLCFFPFFFFFVVCFPMVPFEKPFRTLQQCLSNHAFGSNTLFLTNIQCKRGKYYY